MGSIKLIAIAVISVFFAIIAVTNEKFRKVIAKIMNIRIFKTRILMKNILVIIAIIGVVIVSTRLLIKARRTLSFLIDSTEYHEEVYNKGKEIAFAQNKKCNKLMKIETNIDNCKNPYIPEGFKYLEGEWNTGFVIEDENKNQFVWVPCTNIENEENIPILKKESFKNEFIITYYEEDDFEVFVKSCLENGGFYIARYEMSNENGFPVSKIGNEVWTNIDYKTANDFAKNMYNNINSRLLNGYSYDIAVNFILDEVDIDNLVKGTGITGNKAYKNIYDLVDDYGEWTEEMEFGERQYRKSIISDDSLSLCDRFELDEDSTLEMLGFRTIIYR